MDSEKPPSLRSLITRMACTLIGLLLLYVLSIGPVACVSNRFEFYQQQVGPFYTPLIGVAQYIGLMPALEAYVNWWQGLAPSWGIHHVP